MNVTDRHAAARVREQIVLCKVHRAYCQLYVTGRLSHRFEPTIQHISIQKHYHRLIALSIQTYIREPCGNNNGSNVLALR